MVVCLVPAAPALLPRLTGTRVPEVAPVRSAVAEALGALVALDRVVVVSEDVPGTLAGVGAPGPLAPARGVDGPGPGHRTWPRELADELLDASQGAGAPPVREHRTWAGVTADLTAELDAAPGRVGVLLLADGSRTRGPRAPGGEDLRGDAVDAELVAALEQGRTAEVPDAPLVGATAAAAVALLAAAPGGPTRVLHHGAPLGVAYLVAVRRRGEGRAPASRVAVTP